MYWLSRFWLSLSEIFYKTRGHWFSKGCPHRDSLRDVLKKIPVERCLKNDPLRQRRSYATILREVYGHVDEATFSLWCFQRAAFDPVKSNSMTQSFFYAWCVCACRSVSVCMCEEVCRWISYEEVDRFERNFRCVLQSASNREPPLERYFS